VTESVTAPDSPPAAEAAPPHGPREARLLHLVTASAVAVALGLVVLKAWAWWQTDSVAVLSTAVDSLLDAGASLLNLFAVRQALKPPSRKFRFGHGKAEAIASLGQALFISGSAVYLLIEAGKRLVDPQPLPHGAVAIGVMIVAIVLTVGLVAFQRFVVRRTASLAVRGDSVHYTSDVLVNLGVIIAVLAVQATGQLWIDSAVGGVIALFILWSARTIARDAILMLMDREMSEADRRRIRQIALAHPEVGALHDMRTRMSGPTAFIQMHLEMDGDMTLRQAHHIADEVEADIMKVFPNAEVLVHEDPEGEEEPPPRLA